MKKALLVSILFFLVSLSSFAQNAAVGRGSVREEIWIAPIVEANLYSISSAAAGGGLAIGYGDGAAMGIRALYYMDLDNLTVLETTALVRFYISDFKGNSGLFLQIDGGSAFFFKEDTDMRMVMSIGLSIGWRFLINKEWYVEPYVRGGFPYLAGIGVSSGFRF